MAGVQLNPSWDSSVSEGKHRLPQYAQLCPRAHTKYMSFLTICVTFISHLLHEPDPDVHTLRMHSCSHENVLVSALFADSSASRTYIWIHTAGSKRDPSLG